MATSRSSPSKVGNIAKRSLLQIFNGFVSHSNKEFCQKFVLTLRNSYLKVQSITRMDWVHCNHCYTQPGDVKMKKFFITNCGHIYCNECLQMNESNECQICHIKYTTIPLTSNMNPEVEIYFHDPVLNLKKQLKILEYQQSHRIRLATHNREWLRNYKALKKENRDLSDTLKLCKQSNQILREEINRMKESFLQMKKKYELSVGSDHSRSSQSTPRPHSFNQFLAKGMTPRKSPKHNLLLDEQFSQALKRTPNSNNFFLMTESKPSNKDTRAFTTPDIPKFPGKYRSDKMTTPELSTPVTPESIIRELHHSDPLQRKVKLPGSKNGPGLATKMGFHGLTLSRPTSTPKKESILTNKYMKYFK